MKPWGVLYPEVNALIQFNPELEEEDCTSFYEYPSSQVLIELSTKLPFEVMVETLIHELAHAVIGPDKEDHGEEWELVLENIRCKHNELLELTAQKFGEGNSIGSDVLYLYFLY